MMTGYRQETRSAQDGYQLSVRIYEAERPRGVVRMIHGMEEHQGRYESFAEYLRKRGFTVMTADMRGHGENAPLLSHIADREGDRLLVEDEKVLLNEARALCPEAPLYLFAHSMGTIIARRLLQSRSGDFEKVALSGYPNPQGAAAVGAALAGMIGRFKGMKGHSALLDSMVLGGFSKAVPDAESPLCWLSVRKENWQQYAKDPLCGVPFTIGSYQALFRLLDGINRPALASNVKKTLPILLISGREDPCTGGEKGRADSERRLRECGFENVKVLVLDGMRHEILNEEGREAVFEEITRFFAGE